VWAPAVVVSAAVLLPVVYLVVRAAGAGPGLWDLIANPRTVLLIINTLVLAAAVTATALLIAVPIAWLTTRTDLPWANGWGVLASVPLVVPSYVCAFTVGTFFGPVGSLQRLLEPLIGVARLPDIRGFPGAWLTLSLVTYPYVLLSARAGLRGIDPSMDEAARSLGEGEARIFRRITAPLLWPSVRAGAGLVALYVLSDFGAVSMMHYESLTTAIYLQYQGSFNRHYAAALSLVLVALAILIGLPDRDDDRPRFHRLGAGAPRRRRLVALGRWTAPALIFCTGVVGVGIALPVGVLVFWMLAAVRGGEPWSMISAPLARSVYVSAITAAVALLAALPIGVLSVRYGGRLAALSVRLAHAAYALPGLVVALSLVFMAARYAPIVYQTMGLLVFAYVVHFLPQALGPIRAALLQVNPSQEEAARTLGRTQGETVRTVTIPLVRSGMVAAAALVFLTTMKELPATLLLSPTGFETLATYIWSATNGGQYSAAAPAALVLLAASSASLWWLLRRDVPGPAV
jgi:iron(III) transport system permease protein